MARGSGGGAVQAGDLGGDGDVQIADPPTDILEQQSQEAAMQGSRSISESPSPADCVNISGLL